MQTERLASDVATLRRIPLFAALSQEELVECCRIATRRRARARERIVRQGERDASLYVVLDGRLRVSAVSEAGAEVTLEILAGGDIFGDLAVIDGRPRSASVVALAACSLLVFPRDVFRALLARFPALALSTLEMLAARVRTLAQRAEDGVALDARARLAKALLTLSARFGSGSARRREVDLGISQRDLAELVGTKREIVNRIFRAWSGEGILHRLGGTRLRLDEEALRRAVRAKGS
jgi:CRP-like cAMP-binding protein